LKEKKKVQRDGLHKVQIQDNGENIVFSKTILKQSQKAGGEGKSEKMTSVEDRRKEKEELISNQERKKSNKRTDQLIKKEFQGKQITGAEAKTKKENKKGSLWRPFDMKSGQSWNKFPNERRH